MEVYASLSGFSMSEQDGGLKGWLGPIRDMTGGNSIVDPWTLKGLTYVTVIMHIKLGLLFM